MTESFMEAIGDCRMARVIHCELYRRLYSQPIERDGIIWPTFEHMAMVLLIELAGGVFIEKRIMPVYLYIFDARISDSYASSAGSVLISSTPKIQYPKMQSDPEPQEEWGRERKFQKRPLIICHQEYCHCILLSVHSCRVETRDRSQLKVEEAGAISLVNTKDDCCRQAGDGLIVL